MLLGLLIAGAMMSPAQEPQERERERERREAGVQWHLADKSIVSIRRYGVQLRSLNVEKARRTRTNLLVVDPFAGPVLSPANVRRLQRGRNSRRVVLAYVRASELDTKSPIWRRQWDADKNGIPDAGAPAWLGNRQSDGDYTVRYWMPAWDAALFKGKDSLIQGLIKTGYDGMVVDIGRGLATKEIKAYDAEQALGKLLLNATTQARIIKREFFSVVMNPAELMKFGDMLLQLDGVLVDGFFYGNEKPNQKSSERYLDHYEKTLEELAEEGRLVMTVAYTTNPAQIRDNAKRAKERGLLPFATVKALDRLPNQ